MDCTIDNIVKLKRHYPDIAEEICFYEEHNGLLAEEITKNGLFTLMIKGESPFYLHSRYDPDKEASNFASEYIGEDGEVYILYGFGLGYHVGKCLDLLDSTKTLVVFENNLDIFCKAIKNVDLSTILEDKRLKLIVTSDKAKLLNVFSYFTSMDTEIKLILHPPSVRAIPEGNNHFKFLLESWNLKKNSYEKQKSSLKKNSEFNTKHIKQNISRLFGLFTGRPGIIVGAGPSLDLNKAFLKGAKGKALIFSCGTALKPLLHIKIYPDIFMISDSTDDTYDQIKGLENLELPAVFLSTASRKTVAGFHGDKLIAHQNDKYSPDNNQNESIDTGGSVVTSMIDIAIKMGLNPIIFVGLDLAYTNGKHHADGTGEYMEDNRITTSEFRTVKGIHGKILPTSLGFLTFKNWIESKVLEHPNIKFINCTEHGAVINGVESMPLSSMIDTFQEEFNYADYIKSLLDK